MASYERLQTRRAKEVTPDDDNDILLNDDANTLGCVLYVGTSGNLHVLTYGGDDVTFTGFSGFLPVLVKRVYEDSTATNIVALW
jgi:hypothetical protein